MRDNVQGERLSRFVQKDLMEVAEHRAEIENRMKNLFWTVCGDYGTQIHPDLQLYMENPDAALYETVRYGAFSKYFQADDTALYLWKKSQGSRKKEEMMMLFHLCMEQAVYGRLVLERKGIEDMRRAAEEDLRREEQSLLKALNGSKTKEAFTDEMEVFKTVKDTDAFIRHLDRIFNRFFEPDYEYRSGTLQQVLALPAWESTDRTPQECLSDEQMDEVIRKYLEDLKKDMLRIRRKKKKRIRSEVMTEAGNAEEAGEEALPDPAAANKIHEYVCLNYGKSCLSEPERENLQKKYCRGIHKGCRLHFTEGILQAPVVKNNPYRYSQMQMEKNKLHYYNNHWVVKRNITDLADILQKVLVCKADADGQRAVTGRIVPGRLWKVGRTEDEKLFDRRSPVGSSDYVLDILLDCSGSQARRQHQAAVQGYIITEALSRVKIPHRVLSFCSFWDHTILRRFRDYEDPKEQNQRLMEYRATGNNRDGLAIRVAGQDLLERPEANRILIVLSDGKPCDTTSRRPGTQAVKPYQGDEAVRDTALAVRELRSKGITVLGIFSGDEAEVGSEKKIYGKDFAYIRDLRSFSKVVGSYLKRQIEVEE